MKPLTDSLEEHRDEIMQRLYLGYVHWDNLLKKLGIQEGASSSFFKDEQAWTFLVLQPQIIPSRFRQPQHIHVLPSIDGPVTIVTKLNPTQASG